MGSCDKFQTNKSTVEPYGDLRDILTVYVYFRLPFLPLKHLNFSVHTTSQGHNSLLAELYY